MICLALPLSDFVFILLINTKMPTTVGILTMMNRIKLYFILLINVKMATTVGILTIMSRIKLFYPAHKC